jgi:hypothetical protein
MPNFWYSLYPHLRDKLTLLFLKVSSYYHQLALSQATGDKGPTGPGGFPPDPFQFLQAQVGPVGPRGPPGTFIMWDNLGRHIQADEHTAVLFLTIGAQSKYW